MKFSQVTLEQWRKDLENNLAGSLEEQLSLALRWAQRHNPKVLEITQRLLEEGARLTPLFEPEDPFYALYQQARQQHWQRLSARQWLSGFRDALGLSAAADPNQLEPPAAQDCFPALSPRQAQALLRRGQIEEQLFQVQAPYFQLAGRQAGLLVGQWP